MFGVQSILPVKFNILLTTSPVIDVVCLIFLNVCDTEELIGGDVTCAGLEISVTTHYAQELGTSVTALDLRFTIHKAL